MRAAPRQLIREGVNTSRALMSRQDRIWSRYSRDKADIGETLARVLRTLSKTLPLGRGIYLLDIERPALDVIRERVKRQALTHVFTLRSDYTGPSPPRPHLIGVRS